MTKTIAASILISVCFLALTGCGKGKSQKEREQVAIAQTSGTQDAAPAEDQEAKQAQSEKQAKEKDDGVAQERLLTLLKGSLKDGDSAKFRNIKIGKTTYDVAKTKTDYAICGEVNSKNAFGGYVGFSGFAISGNIRGEPTIYMQDDGLGGVVWRHVAQELGCLSNP